MDWVATGSGEAVVIEGPPPHEAAVTAVLRGLGAPAEKSLALLLVSVHPLPARKTALVFDGAGVGPVPSKQFAVVPKPTKSCTPAVGHEIAVNALVLLTS